MHKLHICLLWNYVYHFLNAFTKHEYYLWPRETLVLWMIEKVRYLLTRPHILVKGDSWLMVKQVTREYQCLDPNLQRNCEMASKLLHIPTDVVVLHVSHEENEEGNELAQHASRYKETLLKLVHEECPIEWCLQWVDSWIKDLVVYLKYLSISADFKLKQKAPNYVFVLYKRGCNGILLKCVWKIESFKIIAEVREGIFGSHRMVP